MQQTLHSKEDQLFDLIARCALKDSESFKFLYEATSAKLFGVALRILKTEARAEEALQEAYLKVWRSAGSYSTSRGRPMTWLINIVRNQSLDMLRASVSRQEEAHVVLDEELEDDINLSSNLETSDELKRLMHCMKQLSEDQQTCILMVYHKGFTPTEASKKEGWPLGTVKTWLRRGLASIRWCLKS